MPPFPDLALRHPIASASVVAGLVALAGAALYLVLRRRPTPEELELRRRTALAATGRLIDGTVHDAIPTEQQPNVLFYRYRVSGVTYDCSQDVSGLGEHLAHLRLDLPIQVRYDPHNPGDSIVVSETWNGLWDPSRARKQASGAALH